MAEKIGPEDTSDGIKEELRKGGQKIKNLSCINVRSDLHESKIPQEGTSVDSPTPNPSSNLPDESGDAAGRKEQREIEYNMKHRDRGHFILFNMENFKWQEGMKRKGTHEDATAMKETFKLMGFNVWDHKEKDLTGDEVIKELETVAKQDHTHMDCVAVGFLSHGESCLDMMDGKDTLTDQVSTHDMQLKIEKLTEPFRMQNCHPSLQGKPKLFFIQTCRGDKLMEKAEYEDDNPTYSTIPPDTGIKGKEDHKDTAMKGEENLEDEIDNASGQDENKGAETSGQEENKGSETSGQEENKGDETSGQEENKGAETSGQQENKGAEMPGQKENKGAETSGQEENKRAETSGQEENKGAEMSGQEENKGAEMSGQEENKGAEMSGQDENQRAETSGQQENKGAETSGQEENKGDETSGQEENKGADTSGQDGNKRAETSGQQENKGAETSGQEQYKGAETSGQEQYKGAETSGRNEDKGAETSGQNEDMTAEPNEDEGMGVAGRGEQEDEEDETSGPKKTNGADTSGLDEDKGDEDEGDETSQPEKVKGDGTSGLDEDMGDWGITGEERLTSGIPEKMPFYKDFLVAWSTAPGYISFRNETGSQYIQKLCQYLKKYHASADLLSILTWCNSDIAHQFQSNAPTSRDDPMLRDVHEKKQMPWYFSRLTKDVYFPPKPKESLLEQTRPN